VIVMKFGGTSLADAARIAGAAEIVRGRLDRGPVVVVSALAGVTDLLARAVAAAREGSQDALEPILADLFRRHSWATSGSVSSPSRRHDLDLEVGAIFEDLRQLLRSVRVLGEGTPRASDAVLAVGEILACRIVTAALIDRGVAARGLDAREIMITNERHGAAEADLDEVTRRAARLVPPSLLAGEVPVVGGFYGATRDGRTTTLGRGGSDTSAAVLGCALGVDEIEIWTDVDGIMTADPRRVPRARTCPVVSFPEAAELAFYGAKVLHPAAIAPAVRRKIPVRVLNTLKPEGAGTLVVESPPGNAPPLVAVVSRDGVASLRVSSRTLRIDPGFLAGVLDDLDAAAAVPDLAVFCETGVTVALAEATMAPDLVARLEGRGEVRVERGRAIACVVGHGLAADASVRGRVLAALAAHGPEVVALGGSAASASMLLPGTRLDAAVRALHQAFFEEEAA
jgi:aspartate kinase